MASVRSKKLLNLSIYGANFALLNKNNIKAALVWQRLGHLLWTNEYQMEAGMSEYMREKKKTAAENAEQEKQLMKALYKLIEAYPNYEKPYLRKDGDIVIPLDSVMKQNRAAFSGLATVFSEFMKTDIDGQRKRYSTWVK